MTQQKPSMVPARLPATETVPAQQKTTRPNEQGSVTVSAFFKIWDPNNKKTYVEGRA